MTAAGAGDASGGSPSRCVAHRQHRAEAAGGRARRARAAHAGSAGRRLRAAAAAAAGVPQQVCARHRCARPFLAGAGLGRVAPCLFPEVYAVADCRLGLKEELRAYALGLRGVSIRMPMAATYANDGFPSTTALRRYSIATQQVNGIVKAELGHQRRVRFPDCSYDSVLLTPNRTSIQPELMPDGLHPSADAWDALATACLDAGLAQLLSSE